MNTMIRKVQVGENTIEYNLIRKNVKRINLRVKLDGTVCISANDSEPLSKIDEFVIKNVDEIFVLKNGEILSSGTYKYLQTKCEYFKELSLKKK